MEYKKDDITKEQLDEFDRIRTILKHSGYSIRPYTFNWNQPHRCLFPPKITIIFPPKYLGMDCRYKIFPLL